MGRLLGHTGCHPGKKVIVKLRDGRIIIDRFKERTDKHVILSTAGKIPKALIDSFSIYRQQIERK